MEEPTLKDFDVALPEHFPVTVILQSRPAVSKWATEQWDAVGIVVAEKDSSVEEMSHPRDGVRQVYHHGLQVRLYQDEVESYYHNLMSPHPGCYVVATVDEESIDPAPTPFLVTLSFDQANAYLEGDESVFAVPVPAELYRWVEAFVLQYYVPEKKLKRKLKNWKEGGKP